MLVFEEKCVCFLRMNVFIRERRPKSAFSIERLYNVGSQMSKNDDLEVGCLENDNGEPPFITFSQKE